MFRNINRHFSEEAFLHATFGEFIKCWGSGAKSRLSIESVNGNAFVNFSAYLGHPGDAHFVSKKETKDNVNANPKSKSRGKSKRKTERDNQRAARFQKKKREEGERAAESAAATSSPAHLAMAPSTSPPPPDFAFSEPIPQSTSELSMISSEGSFNVNMNVDGNATIASHTSTQPCKEILSTGLEAVEEHSPLAVKPVENKDMQASYPVECNVKRDGNATTDSHTTTQAYEETSSPGPEAAKEDYPISRATERAAEQAQQYNDGIKQLMNFLSKQ